MSKEFRDGMRDAATAQQDGRDRWEAGTNPSSPHRHKFGGPFQDSGGSSNDRGGGSHGTSSAPSRSAPSSPPNFKAIFQGAAALLVLGIIAKSCADRENAPPAPPIQTSTVQNDTGHRPSANSGSGNSGGRTYVAPRTTPRAEPRTAPTAQATPAPPVATYVTLEFPDFVYTGYAINGVANGTGKSVYHSGYIHEGNYENGRWKGNGYLITLDKIKMIGNFDGAYMSGPGEMVFPNGNSYMGVFDRNELKTDNVTITYPDKNFYRGPVNDQLNPNGYGTHSYEYGVTATGMFKNGQYDGKMRFVFADGHFIESVYHDGIKVPEVRDLVMKLPNGGLFSGRALDLDPDGQGKYTMPNGEKYEGNFTKGLPNGYGVYTWPDGKRYEGNFLNDKIHGQGKITTPEGNSYAGSFVDGKQTGQGIYTRNDGYSFIGEFKDGLLSGDVSVVSENYWYEGRASYDRLNGKCTVAWKEPGALATFFEGSCAQGLPNGDGLLRIENESTQREAHFRRGKEVPPPRKDEPPFVSNPKDYIDQPRPVEPIL